MLKWMWKALRFHYSTVWLVILAVAEFRQGLKPTALDFAIAIAMQVLSFPANILVALGIGVSRVNPDFWGTRAGTATGWALFFLAGFVQWFVVLPWIVRKVKQGR